MNIELIGGLAAFTSTISLFPQIYKIHQTKCADDLSFGMLWNFLITSILWVYYGYLIQASSVWVCNLIMTLAALVLLVLKIKYTSRKI